MNGADLLCDTLLANDVNVCFANPGTSEMHFVAALDRKPDMRCVLGLFEGVVTGAADGYARMTGKPAATLLHLGPGLANGLANLHNARRAHTPMLNIVGEHASHHLPFDAPLTSDIESLARPMSHWVHRIRAARSIGEDTASAIEQANGAPGRIATLILPADAAWSEIDHAPVPRARPQSPSTPDTARIRAAAKALRSGAETVILLSGAALRANTLATASRIAQATGARLLAQQSNARIERGAGRVAIDRVPYQVDLALAAFASTRQLVLVGARAPVAFFAYPDKPSSMLPPDCQITEMVAEGDDLALAIEMLADELQLPRDIQPELGQRRQTALPQGALTSEAIAAAIAQLLPENAIVCDESVSSGRNFFNATHGARPHDFLQLTGGAIGIGLPLALGAAIACPDRKVVLLQADGSGMYTLQALWTQARENLDVVTIIFANRRYAILHNELKNVGAGIAGHNASRMLDLDNPELNWVKLANGMGVEAARAHTAEEFATLLAAATARKGPFLIEAMI
ncbi:MAG TPA: acetolactate synthase large subunit [Devosia sp.]|nr:acetolactate synthase large subunit [Devosia sp.]